SPSSGEAETPAAVQPFAVGKRVVAIAANPANAERTIYWWSDGGYSEWHNTQQKFVAHAVNQGAYFNERNWPAGKQVAAIWPNPVDSNLTIYWWSDGGHSDWDNTAQRFVQHTANQGSWFDDRGWPAGKRVAAIVTNPSNSILTTYWWSDGSYSEWANAQREFVSHAPNQGPWFDGKGWPAGKRVAAIVEGPADGYTYYWWADGSVSMWKNAEQIFESHFPDQTKWFDDRGWPNANPWFNPAQHKVNDVRVNLGSAGGVIYANGRMQYKVVVRTQIVDKVSGRGVSLSDLRTSVNQAGQARDLVTLYLGDYRVDTAGANLLIDGAGDYASSNWKASRTDAGYDKYLNVFAHYSEQIDGSIVEHSQDDDAAYPASAGWKSYVYWVSGTEQTGPDPMSICARVGGYSSDGNGYWDTCANGRDESAKVRALAPRRFGSGDYRVQTSKIAAPGGEYYHNYTHISVSLNKGSIFGYEHVWRPTHFMGSCIAGYSKSYGNGSHNDVSLGKNDNVSLYVMPFKSVTSSIRFYGISNGTPVSFSVPVNGLNSNVLNFVRVQAMILGEVGGFNYVWGDGVWSNCSSVGNLLHNPTFDADGGVRFFDSFGNQGELIFRRQGLEYVIK
ncbi:hypothetical protein RA180_22055, partial [Aeromonas salmonicida]|uniref:hypothetical protein n=1 Tax=Aeromonas salmonicida TaxID=645 RepID=UPI002796A604